MDGADLSAWTNLCGAPADLGYLADDRLVARFADFDKVADPKGRVEFQSDAGKKVGDDALQGDTEDQSNHAGGGPETGYRQVEDEVSGGSHGDTDNDQVDHQLHQRRSGRALKIVLASLPDENSDQSKQKPGDSGRNRGTEGEMGFASDPGSNPFSAQLQQAEQQERGDGRDQLFES